jgi:hypothetical protein
MIRIPAFVIVVLLSLPAAADPRQAIADGHEALRIGDASAAARHWEAAAIADVQGSYHLLVTLYESGPDPSPDLAFMWAWIGQARTWDPDLVRRANEDFDRLQDRTRREVRRRGADMAKKWLEAHPRPAFAPTP